MIVLCVFNYVCVYLWVGWGGGVWRCILKGQGEFLI